MLITTEHELKDLISKAMQARAVALDTEFVWERTFYPILGLVQLAIDEECYLIDPVAIKDLSPLGELLAAPSVIKILHDAQQDLTILKAATGANPKNIFDTRLAYGFCGATSILSLAALLETTLNVKLAKTETRANWLMRPLTDKMFDYACDDVRHLCELMDFIMDGTKKQKTAAWLKTELETFDSPALYLEIDPREYYKKIKGSDQLKGVKLSVLREIVAWREKIARQKNRPRGHIIHNNSLIALAYKCPRQLADLNKIDRLSPNCIQKYGANIISCIEKGINTPSELWPTAISRQPRHKATPEILEIIQRNAAAFNLDPELVCFRKELNILLNSQENADYKESRVFKGWRDEFMQYVYENKAVATLLLGEATHEFTQ